MNLVISPAGEVTTLYTEVLDLAALGALNIAPDAENPDIAGTDTNLLTVGCVALGGPGGDAGTTGDGGAGGDADACTGQTEVGGATGGATSVSSTTGDVAGVTINDETEGGDGTAVVLHPLQSVGDGEGAELARLVLERGDAAIGAEP